MAAVTTVDRGPRVIARRVTVNAPASELFALLIDPRKHGQVDGSGTVLANVSGPDRLFLGAKFTTSMRMFGIPYRLPCTVTAFEDGPDRKVIEWAHPAGHRWRWEFVPAAAGATEVTESYDGTTSKVGRFQEFSGLAGRNVAGITKTLEKLAASYGG